MPDGRPDEGPILAGHDLVKEFSLRDGLHHRRLQALAGVDLEVHRGECLALVGESGCGKTTLGKCLVGQLRPDAGRVEHYGTDLASLRGAAWRRRRRRLQLVFQDSSQAFDPRMTIGQSLAEAFEPDSGVTKRIDGRARAERLISSVDLDVALLDRFPHQVSGGQRQRLGIARALAADAEVIVLDEPVSALDASVRAQILQLLRELRRSRDVTLIFIGHHLGVVRAVADRVAVLYLGRIVEIGPAQEVLADPAHPYTAALLDAVPSLVPGATRQILPGDVPSTLEPPPGCPFHPRCVWAQARCRHEPPMLRSREERATDHRHACHFPLDRAGG